MINVLLDSAVSVSLIVIGCVVGAIILVFAAFEFFKFFRREKKHKEPAFTLNQEEFIKNLGGESNIVSYKIVGSRLTVELMDISKVDKASLEKNNFDGIIEMKNKIILVKEDLSKEIKSLDDLKVN